MLIRREESQTFFKNTIEEIAARYPVLVIASAENAGRHWKWITNKGVTRDKVQWQDGGGLSTVKNLRIARVRAVEETPQWYAEENGTLGVPAALFTKSDRVYFGIQSTSVALQVTRAARCLSKVQKPNARVAIPRAQEIFLPVLQPGDDPQVLALFVHRMRRMAPQYDGPLKLPVPLHLASQVEEYVQAQVS